MKNDRARQVPDGPDEGGDEGERVHGHRGAGWGLVDPNARNVNRIGVTSQALSDPLVEDAAWRPEVSATLCLLGRMVSVARTGESLRGEPPTHTVFAHHRGREHTQSRLSTCESPSTGAGSTFPLWYVDGVTARPRAPAPVSSTRWDLSQMFVESAAVKSTPSRLYPIGATNPNRIRNECQLLAPILVLWKRSTRSARGRDKGQTRDSSRGCNYIVTRPAQLPATADRAQSPLVIRGAAREPAHRRLPPPCR